METFSSPLGYGGRPNIKDLVMQARLLIVFGFSFLVFASSGIGGEQSGSDPFGGGPLPTAAANNSPTVRPLKTKGPKAYRKIEEVLYSNASVSFENIPLSEAIQELSAKYKIPIVVDNHSLLTKKLNPEMPVTIHLRGLPLRKVLALMLGEIRLDYVIKDGVLQIKTRDDVLREPVALVYVLDSCSQRSDDLIALLQKVLNAKHSDPMPPPIVRLVRDSNPETTSQDMFVQANRLMHMEVQMVLRAFEASPSE